MKVNRWMEHLAQFRKLNPKMDNKLIFAAAKKTYKKSPAAVATSTKKRGRKMKGGDGDDEVEEVSADKDNGVSSTGGEDT
jgi:hypothetical protein